MLEELAMDKKSSIRLGQAQSKGNCSESKKLQDATNGKPFPRNARKREPPNSNGSKPEQNRKPMPQKTGKFPDNRPKPRGGLAFNRGRNENSQMTYEDFEPEFDDYLVVYESGSKKQSLSHLCNFHYEPRGENVPKRSQHTTHGSSTKSLMATQAHKYNKEQFLQANCQFVVREEGDYTFNLGDPDLLVDWDHVELIITSTTDKVICPICLYPPVAGKITRCGHVFCWSCVLHYLALSDKSWRKCPICYESIHKKDLKSVECVEKDLYSVGQKITMRLMKREKGTLVATPVNQFTARSQKPILSYSEKDIDTSFSKLLTASQNDVMNIISREYSELQTQVEEFKGCPEICFVEQALELLTERKSLVEAKNTEGISTAGAIDVITSKEDVSMETSKYTELASSPEDSPKELIGEEQDSNRQSKRSESESAGSEGDEFNISAEDLEIKTTNQAQKHYYFYQAADGQHIYLHSINVRMLEMTHGSLENCPHEITGKIVEKESGSMTTPLRKRLRYLQHVPITCQFEVIELDIRPPVISEETLAAFEEQIEDRRRRRQRQARAEKRREKKIEEAELRRFNRRPAPNLRIESHFHFPEFGLEEQQRPTGVVLPPETSRSGQSSRSSSPKRDRSPFSSAVAALSLDNEDGSSGPSFAQLLREGKTVSSEAWPTLGGGSSSSTAKASSSSGGPVWGRRTRQVSVTHESADSDNDTAFSPPAKPSFNIAEAIQLAASIEKGENTGGRKKKKKQQKILFSTGVPKGN